MILAVPFYGIKIPTPYTKEEFEQDVTQSVIWKIDEHHQLVVNNKDLWHLTLIRTSNSVIYRKSSTRSTNGIS